MFSLEKDIFKEFPFWEMNTSNESCEICPIPPKGEYRPGLKVQNRSRHFSLISQGKECWQKEINHFGLSLSLSDLETFGISENKIKKIRESGTKLWTLKSPRMVYFQIRIGLWYFSHFLFYSLYSFACRKSAA